MPEILCKGGPCDGVRKLVVAGVRYLELPVRDRGVIYVTRYAIKERGEARYIGMRRVEPSKRHTGLWGVFRRFHEIADEGEAEGWSVDEIVHRLHLELEAYKPDTEPKQEDGNG